jgi:AraC-like DNA-binding protein
MSMIEKYQIDFQHSFDSFFIERIKRTESFNMTANDCHDVYEIYYMLSGERYYFIKNRNYLVRKGDLVIINFNELHKTMDASNVVHERILINFRPKFLKDMPIKKDGVDLLSCFRPSRILRLTLEEQHLVETLLKKMIKEENCRPIGYELHVKVLLIELLLFIARYNSDHWECNFTFQNALHEKISEIVSFMCENYHEKITLRTIENQFFISPYYFSRSFKKITGFTFVEYLNRIRVLEGQRLLKDTSKPITCIADEIGYDSVTHFERKFKEITGLAPMNFRKSVKLQ